MSGIVNQGLFVKSGIIRNTISNAFLVHETSDGWATKSNVVWPLTPTPSPLAEAFDDSGGWDTSTYKWTVPYSGIWLLGMKVYTCWNDATNEFLWWKDDASWPIAGAQHIMLKQEDGGTSDNTIDDTMVVNLTVGDVLHVRANGDIHQGMSYAYGCQLG